jgi:hypothetical protein
MKAGFTGYVTVEPPPAHEGIGRALRTAYFPQASDLPKDIAALLDRLNHL